MKNQIQTAIDTEYVSWLFYLPRGVERLKELGMKKRLPREFLLAQERDKTEYCYVVTDGKMVSYEYSVGGEERIYSVYEAESVLLEENLLFDYAVPVNIRTTVATEVVCIDRIALLQAIQEDPEIAVDIMQSLSMKLLSSVEQIRCLNERSAMRKVCNLLLSFAKRYGYAKGDTIVIREKMSQEYISSLLGINRITVVRVMKELREQGLVEKRNGYYCIQDMGQLKEGRMEKRVY